MNTLLQQDLDRPPLPPFTEATAKAKVQAAEDGWNSRDPKKVALAYTRDTKWRNRSDFIEGREEVEAFLTKKWDIEQDYRLRKWLWSYTENRISLKF
jgi:hypothetical protein